MVLYHDSQLETSTSAKGMIYEKTWSELRTARYASPFATDIKILKAEDFIGTFNDRKRIFTFDCKLDCPAGVDYTTYTHTYAHSLLSLIQKNKLEEQAFIESTDARFLALLNQENPRLHLFIYPGSFAQGLKIADSLDLFGITIGNGHITADEVKLAHLHGRRITLWDLHTDSENIDGIKKSPDYMQTDRIIHLLQLFDTYKKQGWKNLQW